MSFPKRTAARTAGLFRRVTAMVIALVFSLLSMGGIPESAAAEGATRACLSVVERQLEGVTMQDERRDSDSRDPTHLALPHCHAHAMTDETAAGPRLFAVRDSAARAEPRSDQVLLSRTAAPPTRPPRF